MTLRKNTPSVLERQDLSALRFKQADLSNHLQARRLQIAELDKELNEKKKAIDAIFTISGRASAGHDSDCQCSYCLIRRVAYDVWKMK